MTKQTGHSKHKMLPVANVSKKIRVKDVESTLIKFPIVIIQGPMK